MLSRLDLTVTEALSLCLSDHLYCEIQLAFKFKQHLLRVIDRMSYNC